jgi:peroxiredoxin
MTPLSLSVAFAWAVTLLAAWLGYRLFRTSRELVASLGLTEQTLDEVEDVVEKKKREAAGLPAGTPAPVFELPDLDGKPVSLEQLRGQRVLLVFFSPECGYCKELAPELARLPGDGRGGRPLPVVVTTGGLEANRALVAQHGIRCPVLLQEQTEVATQYRMPGTPVGYLIDESGVIAARMASGGPAILALAEAPDAAMSGVASDGDGAGTALESVEITLGNGVAGASHARPIKSGGGLEAGTLAPKFTLPRLDGGRLSLDDYRGRPLFLVFSDPFCNACDQIMPQLEELHRHTPDLAILMVSRGDTDANRSKVAEMELTFPVVLQRRWDLSRQYRKFATPAAYLIDGNGVIASRVAAGGAILALALEVAQAVSPGRPAGVAQLSHSGQREGRQ